MKTAGNDETCTASLVVMRRPACQDHLSDAATHLLKTLAKTAPAVLHNNMSLCDTFLSSRQSIARLNLYQFLAIQHWGPVSCADDVIVGLCIGNRSHVPVTMLRH